MKRECLVVPMILAFAACGPVEENPNNIDVNNQTTGVDTPQSYAFPSRYEEGVDSVSYSGQVARQVLIKDLTSFIGSLNAGIDSGDFVVGEEGSVVGALDFYFRFDSETYGDEAISFTTDPAAMQSTYDDVSTGKDLVSKLAGNDSVTDHKDFTAEFTGWTDTTVAEHGGGVDTPEAFVVALFEQIEANAIAAAEGETREGPNGEPLPVKVTAEGWDLAQLTEKFLHGALSLSQGADDYLDDDVEGKGLLAPNTRDDDSPYTVLEHQWDEGFGYFGASRFYRDFSDKEIAETPYADIDGDGAVDLKSEVNYGASTNAAKRDAGSATGTDFSEDVFSAFIQGRAIISAAPEGERLDEATLAELRPIRDQAVVAWEKALAATVVHYINDTIADTEAIGSEAYEFEHHAKVWSEMKGFALAFQFSPHSPLTDQEYENVHVLIRDKPELTGDGAASYVTDLVEARDILQGAYSFDAQDVEEW